MHCYFCCLPCLCWCSLEHHIRDNCQKIYQSWIDSGCVRMNRWELGWELGLYVRGWVFLLRVGVLYLFFFYKIFIMCYSSFYDLFSMFLSGNEVFKRQDTSRRGGQHQTLTHIWLQLRPAARLFSFNIQNRIAKVQWEITFSFGRI